MYLPSTFIVVAVGSLIALNQDVEAKPSHTPPYPPMKPQEECYEPNIQEKKKTNIVGELRSIKEYLEDILQEEVQSENKYCDEECDHYECNREDSCCRGQSDRKGYSYSDQPSYSQKESPERYHNKNYKEESKPIYCKPNTSYRETETRKTPKTHNYEEEPKLYPTNSEPVMKKKRPYKPPQVYCCETHITSSKCPNKYCQENAIPNPYQSDTQERSYKSDCHEEEYKPNDHYSNPRNHENAKKLYHKDYTNGGSKQSHSCDRSTYQDNEYKHPSLCCTDGAKNSYIESKPDYRCDGSTYLNDQTKYPKSDSDYQKERHPPYQSVGHAKEYKPSCARPNPNYSEKKYQQPPQDKNYEKDQSYNPKPSYQETGYQEPQNSHCCIEEPMCYCEDTNSNYHENDCSDTYEDSTPYHRENYKTEPKPICKKCEPSYYESSKPQEQYQMNCYKKTQENPKHGYQENRSQYPKQDNLYKEEGRPYSSNAGHYNKKQDCEKTYEKQSYAKKPIPVIAKCCCKKIEDNKSYQEDRKEPEYNSGNHYTEEKKIKGRNTYKCVCEIQEALPKSSKSNYGEEAYQTCDSNDHKEIKKEICCYAVKPNYPDQYNDSCSEEEKTDEIYSSCADESYSESKYKPRSVYVGCCSNALPSCYGNIRPDRNY